MRLASKKGMENAYIASNKRKGSSSNRAVENVYRLDDKRVAFALASAQHLFVTLMVAAS